MKTINYRNFIYSGLLGLFFTAYAVPSHAQKECPIRGKVTDEAGLPMAYVNIAVREAPDSSLVGGTITDDEGLFVFKPAVSGSYLLTASFIGYTSGVVSIDAAAEGSVDAGTIVLLRDRTPIEEVVIRENRIKAKQQVDRTTYYVNSRMRSASQTGTDLINLVPGIQVDLFNTISLDGSAQIVILVNGVERDPDYIGQLDAGRIDRVEIQSSGGMRYGAEITGVINIILREQEHKGMNGHIYANIPTKSDEVFSFPSARLSYSREKTTWYASYQGGFSYFNIVGEHHKIVSRGDPSSEVIRNDRLKQANWSHKVHFGMDRFSDQKNQISLNGFVSGFSNEQDGHFLISATTDVSELSSERMRKEDTDRNKSAYGSAYFIHRLHPGSEIILEGSYYLLRSYTGTDLADPETGIQLASKVAPWIDEINFRANFNSRIKGGILLETGLQQQFQSMRDNLLPSFNYTERTSAGYFQGTFKGKRIKAIGGVRLEHSHLAYRDVVERGRLFVLPRVDLKIGLNPENHIMIRYGKQVTRPDIHQLNPNPFTPDPFTEYRGNPWLVPEVTHNLSVMYGFNFRENFLSAGLFFRQEKGVIEDLTLLRERLVFFSEKQNLGDLHHGGLKVLGSINLHDRLSIQPHIECSMVMTRPGDLARKADIPEWSILEFRGKLSAVWTIRDDLSLSASLQAQTTTTGIQRQYREGALYFIHLEKLFFDRLKVGLTSAIPFMRSFTYQGFDIAAREFTITSEDNIRMSIFPVWLKIKYSFASGNKVRHLERDEVFEEQRVKKGF